MTLRSGGETMCLTVGSLFAGIGGLDLGLDRAGMKVIWQVEIDDYCRKVLAKHWPNMERFEDVRECGGHNLKRVDLICGGDPCPVRSLAKGSLASRTADLAGYFLAVVGGCSPRWVVRENVPAPDVHHFGAALDALGYRTIVVELDGADFSAQSRRRHFCCAGIGARGAAFAQVISELPEHSEIGRACRSPASVIPCLTAHSNRPGQDSYVYEEGRGLRLFTCEEAEGFMGFPRGWTNGFSRTRRRILLGNAVIPGKAEWIGRRIIEADATR